MVGKEEWWGVCEGHRWWVRSRCALSDRQARTTSATTATMALLQTPNPRCSTLAATTTHELSNTSFTSNTPHGEGIQQTAKFCEAKYKTIHCTVVSTRKLIITGHRELSWESPAGIHVGGVVCSVSAIVAVVADVVRAWRSERAQRDLTHH